MKFSTKAKALAIAALIAVSTAQPAHAVDLTGSGASFVDPLLQACKAGFAKATNNSYVYSSTGSGTGKKNADAKIGDFWFSDSAHTGANKRSTIFHAPIVAAPIAVLVNLPVKNDIYLSAATVAGCRIPICAGAGGTMSMVSAVEFDDIPMPPMSNASASRLRRIIKSLLE